MPQQPPTTFRIEDLKARLKLEPKSRLFYPLAEELRKLDRFEDAEKVLRSGLAVHSSYVSAWISLGRVLQEQQKHEPAVETLQRACTLDPGNVVAARLLGDSYYALGQPVEAIKKYKLVRALLPADESVRETIARLEVEIHRGGPAAPALPMERQFEPPVAPAAKQTEPFAETEPFKAEEPPVPLTPAFSGDAPVQAVDVDAAMSGAAFTQITSEDRAASLPRDEVEPFPVVEPEPQRPGTGDVFTANTESTATETPGSPLVTKTMADLYQRQGHTEEAREIYGKLAQPAASGATEGSRKQVVQKLESWLSKVGRK